MTATSEWNGRPIAFLNGQWVFVDNPVPLGEDLTEAVVEYEKQKDED